ncbi:tryptophan 2,3-dioxygenase family protein [Methylobacter sp.]|jgi:tryptophan 2,3-dioxygenase|uniref:tryptophan 2,3-dioxygenase family protein n=1 Tax=Methylobacter sp. TaxID=2051955 RepID=UPI003DA6CADE
MTAEPLADQGLSCSGSLMQYADYLQLDCILSAQAPVSGKLSQPIHDEHFFIILHQANELWFKQILVEAQYVLSTPPDDPGFFELAKHKVERITMIEQLLINHLDLIRTLDAEQFMRLRRLLATASGSQSLQFMLIEAVVGIGRTEHAEGSAKSRQGPDRDRLLAATQAQSLHDVVADALAAEWSRYRYCATAAAHEATWLPLLQGQRQVAMADSNGFVFTEQFDRIDAIDCFDSLPIPAALMALQAATGNLPRHRAIHDLLTSLVQVEELILAWRRRHAELARTLLDKLPGTGGSSGYSYLKANVDAQRSSALRSVLAFAKSAPGANTHHNADGIATAPLLV